MARPTKNNVDYFSHDCDMRNDIKIKALRRKYKHLGYSIYIITLELLGDTEYFQMKWNDDVIELLSSEYDCDTDELKEIINYCIQLDLLQLTYGYLHCVNFTKRLEDTVLSRRKDYCSNNSPISKLSGVNVNNNDINDNINRQSKVKESKLNESIGEESKLNETKVISFSLANKLLTDLCDWSLSFSMFEEALEEMNNIGFSKLCMIAQITDNEIAKVKECVRIRVEQQN
jgi:hypothetical protein